MTKSNGFTWLLVLLIILLAGVGAVGYITWHARHHSTTYLAPADSSKLPKAPAN